MPNHIGQVDKSWRPSHAHCETGDTCHKSCPLRVAFCTRCAKIHIWNKLTLARKGEFVPNVDFGAARAKCDTERARLVACVASLAVGMTRTPRFVDLPDVVGHSYWFIGDECF